MRINANTKINNIYKQVREHFYKTQKDKQSFSNKNIQQ